MYQYGKSVSLQTQYQAIDWLMAAMIQVLLKEQWFSDYRIFNNKILKENAFRKAAHSNINWIRLLLT